MEPSSRKDVRIEFRTTPAEKELIARAAHIKGQTLSAYAVGTLLEDASQVIDSAARIELSSRDRELFLALLDSTEEPNEALREAAHDYLESREAALR
jgi:uncharacterized protein (DUF1778 family)